MDQSDLCKKSQVEENNGWIEHYDSSDNAFDSVNVSSHELRYLHCEEHSTSVYCENDPKGDAFTAPRLCNGNSCTIDDCWLDWEEGPADSTCKRESITFNDRDMFRPKCTIFADCKRARGYFVGTSATTAVWNMSRLQNCYGDLKLSC